MVTTTLLSNPSRKVTAALTEILPGRFTYALEYSSAGEILKVRALTTSVCSQECIHKLVTLAATWKLKLAITPQGTGQRIIFS